VKKVAQEKLFEVRFSSTGICVGRLRNEVTVEAHSPFKSVNMLATDEGPFQGGDGTAPTPLEFFLAGLVGCLMTQIRVFSRKMKIPFDELEVRCDATWDGMKTDSGPYVGVPTGFRVDIDIRTDEPEERVEELIKAARLGCFVEQTLSRKNDLEYALHINGATA
jgi:uncharacterized OsmC-like protein